MKCAAVRDMMFRKIDRELSAGENAELDDHLAECASCSREYKILDLPGRLAREIPAVTPSPFFYRKLVLNLEGEVQKAAGLQAIFGLARKVISALAGITFALLSVLAYVQMNSAEPDLYRAYNRVFAMEDQPHRMMLAEQGEITDDSVLSAIAERRYRNPSRK